jgi:rRNA maturation RNase YbeY
VNLVEVSNATRVPVSEPAVARLVGVVLEAEGVRGAELGVQFVGEQRMRTLNREHRGRDEVTDVLSFPLEDAVDARKTPEAHPEAGAGAGMTLLLGDVVVCARRALRQARAGGLPPEVELAVLLAHGTLHILGYDHEVDAGRMAVRQAEVLELVEWEGLLAATP